MKKILLLYLLLLVFLPVALFSQNCDLSSEQQIAFQEANASISKVKYYRTNVACQELIENCEKALSWNAYCSQKELFTFYNEIVDAYNSLANISKDAELYYLQQSINYCNRAINAITDTEGKEGFKRLLRERQDTYNTRKRAKETTEREQKDDDDYWRATIANTFERYVEYLISFPYGRHTSKVDDSLFVRAAAIAV